MTIRYRQYEAMAATSIQPKPPSSPRSESGLTDAENFARSMRVTAKDIEGTTILLASVFHKARLYPAVFSKCYRCE